MPFEANPHSAGAGSLNALITSIAESSTFCGGVSKQGNSVGLRRRAGYVVDVPDDLTETPVAIPVLVNGPAGATPGLTYRAPRDEPPAATAGDVLQGAVAAVLLLMMVAGLAGLMVLVVKKQEVGADKWGVAEWIFFAVASSLMAVGALAAFRSLRYYLTGRHRRRVTFEREP
jgi:hypothetical protein